MSQGTLSKANSTAHDWSECFELPESQGASVDSLAAIMRVENRDILSGMLARTRSFALGVEDGSLSIMGAAKRTVTFRDIMDILAVIATHHRIARMRGVKMINGGSMCRVTSSSDIGNVVRRVPVMPISDLSRMIEIDEKLLKSLISPLIHDGAIKLVVRKKEDGMAGDIALMLQDGFINDEDVKRHFFN